LGDIYRAYKKQIFLRPNDAGVAPFLPELTIPFASKDGQTILQTADAYQVLSLVIENTPAESFGDRWTNLFGQSLSVDLLIDQVRRAYLEDRTIGTRSSPAGDHSSYHVIETLVQHAQKSRTKPDLEPIKQRFLEVELSKGRLSKDEAGYILASHYVQSLG